MPLLVLAVIFAGPVLLIVGGLYTHWEDKCRSCD